MDNEESENQNTYDLKLINFCKLLNYKPEEVFKQDYLFLMKLLLSYANEDAKQKIHQHKLKLLRGKKLNG